MLNTMRYIQLGLMLFSEPVYSLFRLQNDKSENAYRATIFTECLRAPLRACDLGLTLALVNLTSLPT